MDNDKITKWGLRGLVGLIVLGIASLASISDYNSSTNSAKKLANKLRNTRVNAESLFNTGDVEGAKTLVGKAYNEISEFFEDYDMFRNEKPFEVQEDSLNMLRKKIKDYEAK